MRLGETTHFLWSEKEGWDLARKSRKKMQAERGQTGIVYNTAIYARLSIADNGGRGDSIENQIQMIEAYIDNEPELKVVYTFVDNGVTGTDFGRPAFLDMMDAVKQGRVNCIVVKDLSRFGRNYLEAGKYLETVFPRLHVRFISVNDRFDSLHREKNDALLVPLQSILHDMYAKDISQKVGSAIDVKKKSGKFMGKIPPYGYVRDERDRYRLRIHTQRAEIIRSIFKWRMEGLGPVSIARRLNDMSVPTQLQIRYMEGHHDGKEQGVWRGSSVTEILKNPCYMGCTVERKGRNLLCTGRGRQAIPKTEWNLIENTHEPIIAQEVFQKVQRMLEEDNRKRSQQSAAASPGQKRENLLSGMVRCGICGSSVHRSGGYFPKDGAAARYRFYCAGQYNRAAGCPLGAFEERELHNCMFQICGRLLELFVNRRDFPEGTTKTDESGLYEGSLKETIRKLEMKQQAIRSKRNALYADWKEGYLTEGEYVLARERYNAGSRQLDRQLEAASAGLEAHSRRPAVRAAQKDVIRHLAERGELTKEMCSLMVRQVVLNENRVCIYFAFADGYEAESVL